MMSRRYNSTPLHSLWPSLVLLLLLTTTTTTLIQHSAQGLSLGANYHAFMGLPRVDTETLHKPKLILIGGSPGTGKSTFGMSVALDLGILKCISTDTVRAVMRSFVNENVSPALHRSSYEQAFDGDDPVRSWKESCTVIEASVESLVDDAIKRKVGLVVEGVHLVPSTDLIDKWKDSGGCAMGCLLQIQDPEVHKRLLIRRGFITGNIGAEEKKIESYDRVRAIQDEMMKLAKESDWLQIEQKTEPDPLELVSMKLYSETEILNLGQQQSVLDGAAAAAASSVNQNGVTTENGNQSSQGLQ